MQSPPWGRFHGMKLSRRLVGTISRHASPFSLVGICPLAQEHTLAGKDAQLLQHRAVPAQLLLFSCCKSCSQALLNDTLRQGGCCKKSPYVQRAGLVPTLPEKKPSLPKLEYPAPHISDLAPGVPVSPVLCSRAISALDDPPQARLHRDGAEPWEGAGAGSGFRMG